MSIFYNFFKMKKTLRFLSILIFILSFNCIVSPYRLKNANKDGSKNVFKRSAAAVKEVVLVTSPPLKKDVEEPDQGDKMDTTEFAEQGEQGPVNQHIPISSRPESQNCECGFHYATESTPTNEEGEEVAQVDLDQPWQVWITKIDSFSYDVKCGATLINDRMILTLASCVESFKGKPKTAEFLWEQRRININSVNGTTQPGSIKVAEVIIHPKFLKTKKDFGVALIKLASPVDFTEAEGVRPVCLPGPKEHLRLGRDGVLSKLKLEEVNKKEIAQKIPQTEDYNSLYSSYDCKKIYNKTLDNATAKSYLCAGIRSNYTEKYFGTALMVEMANTQLLQIGLLSSRFYADRNIKNTTANLFMKITEILPFIEEQSKKANATWCKHSVMKFNDSAPVSRIVGEAWLGTTSDERVEDPSCVCGFRNRVQQGRIVGGKEANPYEYPWQVLLTISMEDEPMMSSECGGTIINDKLILTAAHCIFDQYKAYNPVTAEQVPVTNAANIKVQMLIHQIDDDPRAKIVQVAKVNIHPEYVEDIKLGYQDYDIALLELETPLSFLNDKGPLPVCLPSSYDQLNLVGKNATVIGWGLTDISNLNSGAASLQELLVPIQPVEKCKELSALEVTDRFVCGGTFDPAHDTLHGDSGGPLHIDMENKDRSMQVGIVSWGDHERRKTEGLALDIQAALYTNVSSPEVLSYIDYFAKRSDSRWCKKDFNRGEPRKPWEGTTEYFPNVNPDCACGTPDKDEPQANTTSEFPWTVLIIKLDKPGVVSYCTGTLINNLFVLTSAHCLRNKDPVTVHLKPTIKHKDVRVQLVKYEHEVVNLRKAVRVSDVHIHPDFLVLEGEGKSHFEKNIGLLRLETPLVFTTRRKVSPICLPASTADTSDFNNKDFTLIGFKKTSKGQKKEVALEGVEGKILNPDRKCRPIKRKGIDKDYLCGQLDDAKASVKIAEGGSVTTDLPSGQMIQIGVMSYSNPSPKSGRHEYASVVESLQYIHYLSQEAKASWCRRNAKKNKNG